MKRIPLTKGESALVDDEDYNLLSGYKWCITGSKYAGRRTNGVILTMHRFLVPGAEEVDHINGNTFDNQRHNLRACEHSENGKNRLPNKNGASKYKGVDWQGRTSTWRARIKVDYKTVYLGDFKTEKEAAMAYNDGAKEYHKQYARLNEV